MASSALARAACLFQLSRLFHHFPAQSPREAISRTTGTPDGGMKKGFLVTSTTGCSWYHLLATYPRESRCTPGRLHQLDSSPEPSPSPISHLALPPWDSPLWWTPRFPRPVRPCPYCQGGVMRRVSHRCRAARPGADAVPRPGLQHSHTQEVFQTMYLCV